MYTISPCCMNISIFSTKLLNLQERRTSYGQVSVEKTSIFLGLKEFFCNA